MKKIYSLLAVLLLASVAQAQDKKATTLGQVPATQQPQPSQAEPMLQINQIAQAAIRAGASSCAARVNQVGNFLVGNTQAGANLIFPTVDVDRRMLSASLEIPGGATGVVYASMSFAPNQANGCGAVYETVVFWPSKCEVVAAKEYSQLKKTSTLQKQISVLDGGPNMRIFLMPAGQGCVGIKKELVL